jgi:hypothetical protein
MRRTAFDEARDQRIADDVGASYIACKVCGKQTLIETLTEYGARCFECYGKHCGQGREHGQSFVKPDPVRLKRYLTQLANGIRESQRSPRSWADRLREREESGEHLTIAQREAWRSVHNFSSPYDA